MKNLIITFIIFLSLTGITFGHNGGTDSTGGHNCSQLSKNEGLCYGYHYHTGVFDPSRIAKGFLSGVAAGQLQQKRSLEIERLRLENERMRREMHPE